VKIQFKKNPFEITLTLTWNSTKNHVKSTDACMLRTIQIKKEIPPSANLSRYRCMKAAQQYYSNVKQIGYSEEGTFVPFSLWT